MQNNQTIKVLYVSPLPPPFGGIARWTEMLYKYGLPKPFRINFVDTKLFPKRKIFNPAKINKPEIKRTVLILFHLIKMLISFRPHIVHLCCSLSQYGIIRDYICVILCKISGAKVVTHYRGNICDFPRTALKGLSYKFLIRLIKLSHVNLTLNFSSSRLINKILGVKQHNRHYLLPNFVDDAMFDGQVLEKILEKNRTQKC